MEDSPSLAPSSPSPLSLSHDISLSLELGRCRGGSDPAPARADPATVAQENARSGPDAGGIQRLRLVPGGGGDIGRVPSRL